MNTRYLEDSQRFPISWIEVRKKRKKCYLGVCHYARKPFAYATRLMPLLIIQDVYVMPNVKKCEEGLRCFNTDCEFNKTTLERFVMSHPRLKKTISKNKDKAWERITSWKDFPLSEDYFKDENREALAKKRQK